MSKVNSALEILDKVLDKVSHEALPRAGSSQSATQLRAKLQVEFRDTILARARHILINSEWQMERENDKSQSRPPAPATSNWTRETY